MSSYLRQLASCLFFLFFSWCSGGMVIIWDCLEVEVWLSFTFNHVLLIDGSFVKTNEEFILVNVYAPLMLRQKNSNILSERLGNFVGKNLCVR